MIAENENSKSTIILWNYALCKFNMEFVFVSELCEHPRPPVVEGFSYNLTYLFTITT